MPRFVGVAPGIIKAAASVSPRLPSLSRGWSSKAKLPRAFRGLEGLLPVNRVGVSSSTRLRVRKAAGVLPNRLHNTVFQAMALGALDEACGLMHSAMQDRSFRPNTTTKRLMNSLLRKLLEAEKMTAAIALFIDARQRKVIYDSSWFFVLLKASVDACSMDDISMVANHALRATGVNATEVLKLAAGPLIIGGYVQSIQQALWRVEDEDLAMSVLNSVAIRLACLFGKRDDEDSTLGSLRGFYEWKFGTTSSSSAQLFSYLDSLTGPHFARWSERHPMADSDFFYSSYRTLAAAPMPDELLKQLLQHPTAKGRFPWLPSDQRATAIPDLSSQLAGCGSELMFHQDLTSHFWGIEVGAEPPRAESEDSASSQPNVVFVDIDLGSQSSARMTVAIQFDEDRSKHGFSHSRNIDKSDNLDDEDDDDDSDSDDEDEGDEHDENGDGEDDEEEDDGDEDDISAGEMIRFLAGTRDVQFLHHDLPTDLTGSMEGVVRCHDLSEYFWNQRGRVRIGFEDELFDELEDV